MCSPDLDYLEIFAGLTLQNQEYLWSHLSNARKQRPAQQDVDDRLQAAGRDGGDGGTGGNKRDFYRFNLILMFFGVLLLEYKISF